MTDRAPPPESAAPAQPSRRKFLALTVAGASLAAAAGGVSWWIREKGELEGIEPPEPMSEAGARLAKLIQDKLEMLEIPDGTVSRWVNRFEQHEGPWVGKKPSRKDLQNFLLSTDFFPDADEDRPLRFVSYYDPYISVCYNPLRHAG